MKLIEKISLISLHSTPHLRWKPVSSHRSQIILVLAKIMGVTLNLNGLTCSFFANQNFVSYL